MSAMPPTPSSETKSESHKILAVQSSRRETISSREDLANVTHPAMEKEGPWQRPGFLELLAGNGF